MLGMTSGGDTRTWGPAPGLVPAAGRPLRGSPWPTRPGRRRGGRHRDDHRARVRHRGGRHVRHARTADPGRLLRRLRESAPAGGRWPARDGPELAASRSGGRTRASGPWMYSPRATSAASMVMKNFVIPVRPERGTCGSPTLPFNGGPRLRLFNGTTTTRYRSTVAGPSPPATGWGPETSPQGYVSTRFNLSGFAGRQGRPAVSSPSRPVPATGSSTTCTSTSASNRVGAVRNLAGPRNLDRTSAACPGTRRCSPVRAWPATTIDVFAGGGRLPADRARAARPPTR